MSTLHIVFAFIFAGLAAFCACMLFLPPSVLHAPFHIGNLMIALATVLSLGGAVMSFRGRL